MYNIKQGDFVKTFCFKLYKSKRNKKLHQKINIAGFIYNHCIALHKRYYRLYKKFPHKYTVINHLTKIKKLPKYKFIKDFNAQSINDIVFRIDRAYKLFFRNVKRNIKSAPPNFKKVRKYKSFSLCQNGWKIDEDNHTIKICGQKYKYFPHKKGWGNDLCRRPSKTDLSARLLTAQSADENPSGVCHFQSRRIAGKIKTVTIKRDSLGDIYIYVVTDAENFKVDARAGEIAGFDFGLKNFLTSSDGKIIKSPLFFARSSKQIAKACRNLSRKKKGSNNRRKAKLQLARLYKKIFNRRKDFHFKLARNLCMEYEKIFIEDLNLKAMQRLWGRKITDLGFYNFVQTLKYEATKFGVEVVEVDRFFASSQTCSQCGFKNPITKNLSVRSWRCPKCGAYHDRDINAAINILKFGLGQRPLQETE